MRSHRWLVVVSVVLLIAVAATLDALPAIARHLAIARLHALTKRPVSIDRVDVRLFSGRFTVHGLHVAEPDGAAPFADCELLDARLHLLSLLRGHLWLRDLVVQRPTLRFIRLEKSFNFSDLLEGSETTEKRVDVTVDRFALVDGTVSLEDRALPERRTWTSENIHIEAHNVSTLRNDGTVVASSMTAGAPNRVEIEAFRLYPIHLRAKVTVTGLDLALARLYLPRDAQVLLDRGRASSILDVTYDAREEVRADLRGELEELVLVKPGEREPVTRIPKLTAELTDFTFRNDQARVGRLELQGSATVRDPRARDGARYRVSAIRASIADVSWPITGPGRLDVQTALPGGGALAVSGSLQPPPASSKLRLRASDVDLAAWNRFVPVAARFTGKGEVDLRVDEPLVAGVPARVRGSIAVDRLGVRDAQQELLGAQRVDLTGLEVQWPERLRVARVVVNGPRAIVERGKQGNLPLTALFDRPGAASPSPSSSGAGEATTKPPRIEIGEIAVRNGVVSWRDETVQPRVTLDVSQVDATITGAGWPLRPLSVKLAVRPPGGGELAVAGRVGIDPLSADLRLHARDAELAHYQAYVPTRAQFSGRADLDLAVVVPAMTEPRATVRGDAALSRVDVRDGQRTVIRIDRASAAGLDVDWPGTIKAREVALRQPWVLLERNESGVLPLRPLLVPDTATAGPGRAVQASAVSEKGVNQAPLVVRVRHLIVDNGGARVVDSGLNPPFAVDIAGLETRVDNLSTAPGARPARIDLKGRVGDGLVDFAGTIGPVTGPLRLDLKGDLREFAVPRTNPYLLNVFAWEARNGRLTTGFQCRIDGDKLQAKVDVLVSRLQLAKAAGRDEAQARVGLPLGMLVSLMKDRHGDIRLALPIAGRVTDPRVDIKQLVWSTVRHATLKLITAPVSWIGRVRVDADSRIERIEVDPIQFEPGTATPTAEGQQQLTRLVAFLDQTPEAKLTATPLVSARDVDAMKPSAVDAAAVSTLAAKRMDSVRATLKKAGIDSSRLTEGRPVENAEAGAPEVKLDFAEPENPGRR